MVFFSVASASDFRIKLTPSSWSGLGSSPPALCPAGARPATWLRGRQAASSEVLELSPWFAFNHRPAVWAREYSRFPFLHRSVSVHLVF